MADKMMDPSKFPIRLKSSYDADPLFLIAATVEEGLSQLTRTTVEFVCNNRSLELEKIVGTRMSVEFEPPGGPKRVFPGVCVSLEFLGTEHGPAQFCAELRPWLWFLTRTKECRIFQDIKAPDLIKTILEQDKYGFSGDVVSRLSGSYDPREYLVQYRETDYDFLCRVMEEEGIYFYFIADGDREKLVLADDVSSHDPVSGTSKIEYQDRAAAFNRQLPHIYDWKSSERVTTGKVTLKDYDFENPSAEMKSAKNVPKGDNDGKKHEFYDYPGHYRSLNAGNKRALVRMEAEAVRHKTTKALSNAGNLGVGLTFTLANHPRKSDNISRLVTRAMHKLHLVGSDDPPLGVTGILHGSLADLAQNADPYQISFETIPAKDRFRAPLVTPWPEIPGVHTAIVVGPDGEEIFTDNYGRIKVQFHWDRLGKSDENSSCWVRTMMPWTGKNWGMSAIPRTGQEVVVQFEEGDPDRPLVIGMLYNSDTMPPYGLPDNMTQSGIKTRSSKKGTGFHELMFEDKKGAELVRFQSERDYEQIVKNDATITVGLEHKDKGNMELTVHKDLTETLKTGDHTFKIETGSQKIDIKKDKIETITGKSTRTVTGNVTETVKTGNQKLDVKAGKIDNSAMQSITLKCGPSSIKIDPSGVTIKGPMIKIEGSAMLQAKAPMTQIQSQLLILKGSLTMIN